MLRKFVDYSCHKGKDLKLTVETCGTDTSEANLRMQLKHFWPEL